MVLIERAKGICLHPKEEWPVIAGEPTSTGTLLKSYVAPLALIGPIAALIGGTVFGRSLPFLGTYRVPILAGIGSAVFGFVMALLGTFLLSLIINGLAPTFGGEKNATQAFKLAAYSYTPAWIAGALQIFPSLGFLSVIAGLYGIYLLYLGLPRLMKAPPAKAGRYTALVVVLAIVMGFVMSAISGLFIGAGTVGRATWSAGDRPSSEVAADPNSMLGKLEQFGKNMETAAGKMEAAQKSGDPSMQAAAATEALGAMLGGGKRVEPVAIAALKPFVPETFADLPRTSTQVEKSGAMGISISRAEARYGNPDGSKQVRLEISDTGGISGLVGLTSWMGVAGEREDENGREVTEKVGGRLVHEKVSKTGGSNEYAVVLGDRFIVTASGNGVPIDDLKGAVGNLELDKLAGLATP